MSSAVQKLSAAQGRVQNEPSEQRHPAGHDELEVSEHDE